MVENRFIMTELMNSKSQRIDTEGGAMIETENRGLISTARVGGGRYFIARHPPGFSYLLPHQVKSILHHLIGAGDGLGIGGIGPLGDDHLDQLVSHVHVTLFE